MAQRAHRIAWTLTALLGVTSGVGAQGWKQRPQVFQDRKLPVVAGLRVPGGEVDTSDFEGQPQLFVLLPRPETEAAAEVLTGVLRVAPRCKLQDLPITLIVPRLTRPIADAIEAADGAVRALLDYGGDLLDRRGCAKSPHGELAWAAYLVSARYTCLDVESAAYADQRRRPIDAAERLLKVYERRFDATAMRVAAAGGDAGASDLLVVENRAGLRLALARDADLLEEAPSAECRVEDASGAQFAFAIEAWPWLAPVPEVPWVALELTVDAAGSERVYRHRLHGLSSTAYYLGAADFDCGALRGRAYAWEDAPTIVIALTLENPTDADLYWQSNGGGCNFFSYRANYRHPRLKAPSTGGVGCSLQPRVVYPPGAFDLQRLRLAPRARVDLTRRQDFAPKLLSVEEVEREQYLWSSFSRAENGLGREELMGFGPAPLFADWSFGSMFARPLGEPPATLPCEWGKARLDFHWSTADSFRVEVR